VGGAQVRVGLLNLRLYAARRPAFIKLVGDFTVWRLVDTDLNAAAKELVVRLYFGGAIRTFETDLCCTLVGPGKAFAEGVAKDVGDLMAAFVADTVLFERFRAADLKEPKCRYEHERRLFSLVLQDAEYQCTRLVIALLLH